MTPLLRRTAHVLPHTLVIALTVPCVSWAQGTRLVTPSVAIATLTDSNVLSAQRDPQSDIVQRLTPSLRIDARSRLWTIESGYTMDAERYERHPQLNSVAARQQADAHLERAGRRVTFSTDALYLATNAAQEINIQSGSGLTVERIPATNVSVAPAMRAWLTARTSVTADASLGRTAYRGAGPNGTTSSSILTLGGSAGIGRRVSVADLVDVQYRERRFDFRENGNSITGGPLRGFRAVLLGWTHGEGRPTSITLTAGPRLSSGRVRPEAALAIRRRVRSGEFGVSAASTEQAAIGETGTVEVQRVTAHLTAQPGRRVELRVDPGIGRQTTRTSGLEANTYLLTTAGTVSVAAWLALDLSFQGVWQRGELPSVGPLTYDRRIVMLRAIVPALRRRDTAGDPPPQR